MSVSREMGSGGETDRRVKNDRDSLKNRRLRPRAGLFPLAEFRKSASRCYRTKNHIRSLTADGSLGNYLRGVSNRE
jgi:hypothetical protein